MDHHPCVQTKDDEAGGENKENEGIPKRKWAPLDTNPHVSRMYIKS